MKKQFCINLTNKPLPWAKLDNQTYYLAVRGYAFVNDQNYHNQELLQYIASCLDEASPQDHPSILKKLIQQFNGIWALVYENDALAIAVVDRMRSIPLFYGVKGNKFLISNDAFEIKKFVGNTVIDEFAEKEFMLTTFVTGPDTLYPDVKQVQGGEIISITKNLPPVVEPLRYYGFFSTDCFDQTEKDISHLYGQMLTRVFDRLVKSAKGNRIVVPLSGGMDSRLVVAMLKSMGVENVLCFSYGRPGNWEAEISGKVAKRLGYQWHFVPESRKSCHRWFQSKQCKTYRRQGSGLTSLVVLQDWDVVGEMKKNNILQDGDIIVPGHSGDFLGGSHIPLKLVDTQQMGMQDVINAIIKKHHNNWCWNHQEGQTAKFVKNNIISLLPELPIKSVETAVGLFEYWDWQERQCKFIVNSVRAYEFWGYDWRIPLWDNEMMDFWLQVPLDLRIVKKLYDSYLEAMVFSPLGIGNLYVKKGLKYKITKRISKFTNPLLGRYKFTDYPKAWRFYAQRFGRSSPSIKRLTPTVIYTASVFLRELNETYNDNK